jgi:hypothetical protein
MFALESLALGAEQLPSELSGYWVPKSASCSSPLGLNVTTNTITFKNAKESRSFANIEPCFSCEGGVQYSGIVIWVSTLGNKEAPFTVYFNANEIKNTALVEIESSELQLKFPLNKVRLKKCKP